MDNIIVSTQWLADNLHDANTVLLDASMAKVVGKEPIIYDAPVYIANSLKLDLETKLCDSQASSANAFPSADIFNKQMELLGINKDNLLVIYDNQGIYSAPRAWWIFKTMGFANVFVLDGGLPKWLAEGRDVVSEHKTPAHLTDSDTFVGHLNQALVSDASAVLSSIDNPAVSILDARASARFTGTVSEPRAGLRAGHIPNSVNLPFAHVLDDNCFKTDTALAAIFEPLVTDNTTKLIFSCGSGITACIILMAAHIAGYKDLVLYDGSWSEWGANHALPIA
ncbi:sulfurtransferase [Catenovulum sp. SM1970]|uniref:sulfurtransferase n=1 Tax=Marinifaba aquimaris TaxID=2741323 RepID=UPI001573BC63|nr:sulfurtransferase [Marinifaba aquimaris]NTS76813.1 sulfurtransferase [Marinifaba aquimaris]